MATVSPGEEFSSSASTYGPLLYKHGLPTPETLLCARDLIHVLICDQGHHCSVKVWQGSAQTSWSGPGGPFPADKQHSLGVSPLTASLGQGPATVLHCRGLGEPRGLGKFSW